MIKTKIFRVMPGTLEKINRFLSKSTIGSIMRQEFSSDEKKRLYLIVTINESEK